jgi:hypothetical protein
VESTQNRIVESKLPGLQKFPFNFDDYESGFVAVNDSILAGDGVPDDANLAGLVAYAVGVFESTGHLDIWRKRAEKAAKK